MISDSVEQLRFASKAAEAAEDEDTINAWHDEIIAIVPHFLEQFDGWEEDDGSMDP